MKKIIVATVAATTLLLTAACEVPEESNTPGAQRATTGAKAHGDKGKPQSKPSKDNAPQESVAQANARASAESYLSTSSFSRTGLIKQLKYEGFSIKDATYGADAVGADWNEQAVKSAKSYLSTSSFSHASLVQQLKYEGFTPAQAEYGVKKVGL